MLGDAVRHAIDLTLARKVLQTEADAILALIDRVDQRFEHAVRLLLACRGRVIVTGMGKSGIICRKIAATLTSTGTPAVFLHSAEAIHGDLGMLQGDDVVIALSYSGETEELLRLLETIKRLGVALIAITGDDRSTLARAADVWLDCRVSEEACPLNLVPTASTTAALALGDALAVVLLELRGFKEEDFALRHPGGTLGRKLLLRVEELMHGGSELPLVGEQTPMKEAILEITSKRLGVTGVVNGQGQLVGIVTDGDLRRGLESRGDIFRYQAKDLMTKNPKTVRGDALAATAMGVMEDHSITSLFVLDGKKPVGVIHLHDLLKAGI